MAEFGQRVARHQRTIAPLLVAAVVFGLLGLPVAVWLDLRVLSESMLRAQANRIGQVIDEMRAYYGSDVVGRILQSNGAVTATHNYRDVPGAIPIPATGRLKRVLRMRDKSRGLVGPGAASGGARRARVRLPPR